MVGEKSQKKWKKSIFYETWKLCEIQINKALLEHNQKHLFRHRVYLCTHCKAELSSWDDV